MPHLIREASTASIVPSGTIAATWDEDRWWTPEESAAFMAALADDDEA